MGKRHSERNLEFYFYFHHLCHSLVERFIVIRRPSLTAPAQLYEMHSLVMVISQISRSSNKMLHACAHKFSAIPMLTPTFFSCLFTLLSPSRALCNMQTDASAEQWINLWINFCLHSQADRIIPYRKHMLHNARTIPSYSTEPTKAFVLHASHTRLIHHLLLEWERHHRCSRTRVNLL